MFSPRLRTGIIAGAIVGTVVFGGMGILLLTSKKDPKKGEKIAKAESQRSSEKSTKTPPTSPPPGGAGEGGDSKAAVRHSEARRPRLEEVEEARESPPRKGNFLDDFPKSPTAKLKDPELPTPKTDRSDLPTDKTDKSELPVWKADADLLKELGPEENVAGYRVRPPKQYEKVVPIVKVPPGTELFCWRSPVQANIAQGTFIVMIARPPGIEIAPLEKLHEQGVEVMQRRRQDKEELASERGRLGDFVFISTRWSGTEAIRGKVHGFSCSALDGTTLIHITADHVEVGRERPLKIAEAAALTFRKP